VDIERHPLTKVSRNGDAWDLFEKGKVLNLKFWSYLQRFWLGFSNLLKPQDVSEKTPAAESKYN